MFWSSELALLMILHSLFSLSTTSMSVLWCSIFLSRWIAKHSISNFFHVSQCTFLCKSFLSNCIGFQLGQNTNWQNPWHFQLANPCIISPCKSCVERTRPSDQCQFYCVCSECLFLGSTYNSLSFSFPLSCIQPLSTPLIFHIFCFSQKLAIQCLFLMLHIFHSFVLLYSSHQSSFLVITIQLECSEVSPCCLQHNERNQIFPVQHSLWHSAALYPSEFLVFTACQQKSVSVNLYSY